MAAVKQSEFCEALTARIKAWFADKKATGVSMEIEDLDWGDPDLPIQDYYEARTFRFRPDSLEKASAEVFVTENAGVGVTIERRGRVYQRCGRRPRNAEMVIMGMEPVYATFEDIGPFLDFAANGELVIDTYMWAGCLFVVPVSMPVHSIGRAFHEVNTSGISAKNRKRLLSWVRARKTTLRYRRWAENN